MMECIKMLRIARKAIPYGLTYLFTGGRKRDPSWSRYYSYISSVLYRCTSKIKVLVSLQGYRFLIRPFAGDDSPLEEIYEKDVYERFFSPKRGDIVIDAGANIGLFSIKASKAVESDGLVIAIEPETENFSLLRRNLEISSSANVIPVKAALGDRCYVGKLFASTSIGHSLVFNQSNFFVNVPVIALNELCGMLKLPRVDFIKINIEGAECMALEGAKATLISNDAKLIVGTHGDEYKERVIHFLKEIGYEVIEDGCFVYAQKGNIG